MEYLKIFGLPHTCTNATERLIQANLEVRVFNNWPCPKHGYKTFVGKSLNSKEKEVYTENLRFVLCVKHPYSWFRSFYDHHKKKEPLYDFIKKPPPKNYLHLWRKPVDLVDAYNKLNNHWLEIENVFVIKQEDLLGNQKEIVLNCAQSLGLKIKSKLVEIRGYCSARKISKNNYEKKQHGLEEKEIQFIKKKIDHGLVCNFGYQI
jgi:hypothetical protein